MNESARRDVTVLQEMLAGKWTLRVLRALESGPAGFADAREAVGGAPEKSLARRLRELRCRGFVRREHVPTSQPRPRYRLTGGIGAWSPRCGPSNATSNASTVPTPGTTAATAGWRP